MATFGEIFNKIKYASGQPDLTFNDGTNETGFIKMGMQSANKIINTIAKGYLNEEIKQITLTAGTNSYSIPTGVDKIMEAYFMEGNRKYMMYYLEHNSFLQLERFQATSNRFIYWTIREGKIVLYPAPTINGQILYLVCKLQPYNLTTDSSSNTGKDVETNVKYGFEDLIYNYVLSEIYLQRENPTMSQVYKNRYDELFIRFKDEVNNATTNPVITGEVRPNLNPNLYPILTMN